MSNNKANPNKENESVKDQVEETLEDAIDEVETEKDQATKDAEKEETATNEEQVSEVDKLKAEVEKEKDKFLRLFAEFENYKRRTSKERLDLFKTAGREVMEAMLPVLDDFDRALVEISKTKEKDLLEGVELISNKLRETLKAKGLTPMNVKKGDTFDADLHEAVTQIPAPEKKLKGKIVDVVESGYTLGDRIIRYPKVVTGK